MDLMEMYTMNWTELNWTNRQYSYFFDGSTDLVDQGILVVEGSYSHSDTPHSVRHLWMDDRTVAEISTW